MMLRCSELRLRVSIRLARTEGASCRLGLRSGKRTAAIIGRFFEVKVEDLS